MVDEHPKPLTPEELKPPSPQHLSEHEQKPRKVKVRHAHKVEGVFETGLDVVEQE